MRVDLQDGDVRRRIRPDDVSGLVLVRGEVHLHRLRTLDDVVVGHDVAGLVDDEAGAEGLLLLGLGSERVPEEGGSRHLDDARGRDLDDAGSVVTVDLVDRHRTVPGERRGRVLGRRRDELADRGGPAQAAVQCGPAEGRGAAQARRHDQHDRAADAHPERLCHGSITSELVLKARCASVKQRLRPKVVALLTKGWEDRSGLHRPLSSAAKAAKRNARSTRMGTSTAKLVDPSAIGDDGRGVAATLARSEFEEALKSGKGPVELFLDVKRVSGGQPDAETQTLDIALERRELKKLLKKTSGDAITLTFDEAELMGLLGDVEAHGIREQALVLTVAAATAVAGAGAYVASTTGHHTTTPAVTQAGYLTTAAAQALGTSVQPVSDAATGGYTAPTIDTTVQAVAPIDAGSAAANPAVIAEQTSDAASGGGYQAGDAAYSAGAPGGYLSSETANVIASESGTPQQTSDAATGGYEAPTPMSGAAADSGYLTTA